MSQIHYPYPVEFQVNGDYSQFQINFPDDEDPSVVEEYRKRFLAWGFPVIYPVIPDMQAIIFSVLAMKPNKSLERTQPAPENNQ